MERCKELLEGISDPKFSDHCLRPKDEEPMNILNILFDVLSFSVKGVAIVVLVLVAFALMISVARRSRRDDDRLEVFRLNDRFLLLAESLRMSILSTREHKKVLQEAKAREKNKNEQKHRHRIFVIDFHGDIAASHVVSLREEVTAIVSVATPEDEVVLRLESSGGVVHSYGLCASQLKRIRDKGLRLVVCVDKVAASGGYLMACLGNEILAAPFAILGSIGVVAPVPNVHRLLERVGVDYDEMTAGEFKRTVSMLGEISPAGRQKFQEQLEETHGLFKDFVSDHRPILDMKEVSTGEHWFGKRAMELKLVDRLITSDDYLMNQCESADIFLVAYKPKDPWRQRLAEAVSEGMAKMLLRVFYKMRDVGSRYLP